jgi:hypothetical protein
VGNFTREPSAEGVWHDFMEVGARRGGLRVEGREGGAYTKARGRAVSYSRMIVREGRPARVHPIDGERMTTATYGKKCRCGVIRRKWRPVPDIFNPGDNGPEVQR